MWDEPPIVQNFFEATKSAAALGVADAIPELFPTDASPFALESIALDARVPGQEVEQRDCYLAIYNTQRANGIEGWKDLFKRRLRSAFLLSATDVESIDFVPILGCARKLPKQVLLTWTKTVVNAWCTSCRMHESVRLSCVFGCFDCVDDVRHYLVCPTLLACAGDEVGICMRDPIRRFPSVLSSLGLSPRNGIAFALVYIMFCMYHERKNSLMNTNTTNIIHETNPIRLIPFSEAEARHCRAIAKALRIKLDGMNIRSCNGQGQTHAGAAPVFIQGLDPWIGAAHAR